MNGHASTHDCGGDCHGHSCYTSIDEDVAVKDFEVSGLPARVRLRALSRR